MTYGELLKKLILFTNTKIMIIANEIGYDISYISKWCNKGILPTSRTISVINKKLAKIFTNEILVQDRLDDFFFSFSALIKKPTENTTDDIASFLAQEIEAVLDLHYRNSSMQDQLIQQTQQPQTQNNLFYHTHVLEKIIQKINQFILQATEDVIVLWTMDICKLLEHINTLEPIANNPHIHVKFYIALDLEEFSKNSSNYTKQLYMLLNKNSTVFFNFYDGKNFAQSNTIIVKDAFASIVSIEETGHFNFAVNITNQNDVRTIYTFFYQKFKTQNMLIRSCTSKEMKLSYRTEFYSRTKFHFFNVYGFEFLLAPKTIDNIIETAKEQYTSDEIGGIIRSLQITWEEIFENREIRFFLIISSILEYLTKGEIYYTDVCYRLTIEERLEHLKNIIEVAKKNSKIKFTILDEDIFKAGFIPRISVFANDKKVFLKNYTAYQTGCGPNLYIVQNKELIKSINNFAKMILDNPVLFHEYSADDLEKVLEEYGTMIYRMMHMNI